MRKRADQLHNNNNNLLMLHRSRANQEGGEQFGPSLDFPGMRGTGGRDPPGMGLNDPKF